MKPSGETEAADNPKPGVVVSESDILFYCPACRGELVVDRAGIGVACNCPHCGHGLVVPEASEPRAVATSPPAQASARFDFSNHAPEQLERRLEELKHQLKENQSQETEMRGHINRATIELHRLQLRLKKLQDRRVEMEAESLAARAQRETGGSA